MTTERRGGARADGGDGGAEPSLGREPAAGKATTTQRLAARTGALGRDDLAGEVPRAQRQDAPARDHNGQQAAAAGLDATTRIDAGARGASATAGLDDPFGFHLLGAGPRAVDGPGVQGVAARGVDGPAQALPHRDRIQASFGRHDVSGVRAHVGGAAGDAAAQIGALAYATGNDVAFAGAPDLHTAAHEAAHVVQQRGGIQLYGGVGQEGDSYEQHADAVADRVVRGESAEALLDRRGDGGATTAAVQRQPAGRHRQSPAAGEDAATRPAGSVSAATELSATAHDVTEAASFVALVSATRRFDDGAVNRLRATLETLGDALFRDAHPRAADTAAVRSALAQARSAADALGVFGPRNRHVDALTKLIGTIEGQLEASAHQPASSSKELAITVGHTLERLERVRDLAAPYAKVDHPGLAAAIAQTIEWRDALTGAGATSAAHRLGTVVPFQHDLVRSADKDLAKVLGDPSIADRGHVVAAFVRAMASADDPATGRAVLDWARSERDRQILRTAEGMLDGAGADVATLGGAKIDALGGQRCLERRIDQLDARLIAGGAVDDLVLRETLVAAREHAFVTAMQALEVQTLQLADACAVANDSLIAKAANHWHDKIKKLPGELRGLAKVPHTFRNEYRHRTAAAHPAHGSGGGADARAERMAMIATQTAALDAIEPEARAWVADGYLQERLKFAETELRDSQVRTLVWTLGATVVQVLVGNFAGAAARNLAEAAMVGRGAMATELAVGAASVATDIGLNTAFQKGVLGDDASLLTIAGLNAANMAVGHLIEGGFRGLSSIEAAGTRNAALWERLAVGEERFVASARMDRLVQLGEHAAVLGTTMSAHMIASAAVDYAARKVAGARATAPGDLTAEDWLLQGAAMGLGRFIAARVKPLADRSFRPFRDSILADRAATLVSRAQTVADSGSVEAANALITEYRALLEVERIQLEAAIAERGGRPTNGQAEDRRANTRATDHLDGAEARMSEVGSRGRQPDNDRPGQVPGGQREHHAADPMGPSRELPASVAAEIANIRVIRSIDPDQAVDSSTRPDRTTYLVAEADLDRLTGALSRLGGDVSVTDVGRGLVVRADSAEWYFERGGGVTVDHAPVDAGQRGELGLPAPNAFTVTLHGFRGVRAIHDIPITELPPAQRDEILRITSDVPLLKYGHVGFSFDGGKTIHGFTPDDALAETIGMEAFMKRIRANEPLAGRIKDDTDVFELAALYADAGWDTKVTTATELMSDSYKSTIVARTLAMEANDGRAHDKSYQFPTPNADADGRFFAHERAANCATMPAMLGIPIPEGSGRLSEYMPMLMRWAAEGPIDVRHLEAPDGR